MKVTVYNQQGEEVGTTLLPKEIFEVRANPDLIYQVVRSLMANRRKVIAQTKDRGEVRGGGRKPWRQKGTGRARAGSIRSPLWRGGGVTFGPTKERVFKKKINKKMKRKALFMVLSAKAQNNLLLILDKLSLEQPKTKLITKMIENWKLKIKNFEERSCLIVLPQKKEMIIRATQNVPNAQVVEARNLNALDLLSFKYLIMPKDTIKAIKETFTK